VSTRLQRWRVPLGFAAAVALVVFAHPTWRSLAGGLPVGLAGLALRASASGHIRKNDALATTGPYAYTRNPLYLGSALLALGLLIAANQVWLGVAALGCLLAVYLPVIKAEERYLAERFGDAFAAYSARVPRLIPRARRRRGDDRGRFSLALYRRHREYQALIGFLALFLLLAVKAVAQSPAPTPEGTLHYTAHWRLLPAGSASLVFSDGQVRFTADANSLISIFYPVRDSMHTDYDATSHCTTAVDNDTVEGRRHRLTHIRYNAPLKQLVLDEVDPTQKPPRPKHEIKPTTGCVMDLLGALAYARTLPLRVGDSYRFPVNEGGATSTVQVAVDLRETVRVPAGSFNCVRAVPTLFSSAVFQRPGKLWIWFSDDARHLPVQIEASVSWGTITAQLSSE
jgi:hypothetical protein